MKIITEVKALYRTLEPRFKFLAWVCLISAVLWLSSGVLSVIVDFSWFHISPATDFSTGYGLMWEIAGYGITTLGGVFTISLLSIHHHLEDRYRARIYTVQ